jgi:hypothetical protein
LEAGKSSAKDLFGSPLEGAAAAVSEDADIEPTIWVCLQCGHQVTVVCKLIKCVIIDSAHLYL